MFNGEDVRFMEMLLRSGTPYNVLLDFWEISCPSLAGRKAVVRLLFEEPMATLAEPESGASYNDMVLFLEKHIIANNSTYGFSEGIHARGTEHVVKMLIYHGASYASICAFMVAMKVHRGLDPRLTSEDLYRVALRSWSMPCLAELWQAVAIDDAERNAITAIPAWAIVDETFDHKIPCPERNILPFLRHMFSVHGSCTIGWFWSLMPHFMRQNDEELACFLALMYETHLAPAALILPNSETWFMEQAIHSAIQHIPIEDVANYLRRHCAGAIARTSFTADLRRLFTQYASHTVMGRAVRRVWRYV